MSRSYFAYEKPSAALVIFTFVTIVQGMLIAIMGLAIGSSIHFPLPIVGFLITGFGMVLIVCQYASTFRRNVYCMWLATAQLLFCCLPCGLMLLIGGCVAAIPLAVSLTTAALNAMWGMSLVEQHSLVPDDHTSEQISLIEIFCAVLIAALILGPASMFYR
ncbi:hypothetical protein C5Y97_26215 [Blastopirellula marina]|uniref:Uncharacterized protein n=2 Tax=Blastopirellula marina TaxID=124 RepID=A0A2S8F7A9_9BACT|nr:hypothetical protein C5Y98_26200 [Blastopirellula marina]PTL41559.1 hypothetical protein C5Y97_26215 [Blastopirellula marina]